MGKDEGSRVELTLEKATRPIALAADLHLSPVGEPAATSHLEEFLALAETRAGSLYIIGDLFDFWVGPGMERLASVRSLLQILAHSPLPITFLPGNRDFLACSDLHALTGIKTGDEEMTLHDQSGKPWHLLHGDQLMVNDHSYQRLKFFLRSWPVKLAARIIPFSLRIGLARRLRQGSINSLAKRPASQLEPDQQTVEMRCQATGSAALICGHMHRCCQYGNLAETKLFVLPPWCEEQKWGLLSAGQALLMDGTGNELSWPPKTSFPGES